MKKITTKEACAIFNYFNMNLFKVRGYSFFKEPLKACLVDIPSLKKDYYPKWKKLWDTVVFFDQTLRLGGHKFHSITDVYFEDRNLQIHISRLESILRNEHNIEFVEFTYNQIRLFLTKDFYDEYIHPQILLSLEKEKEQKQESLLKSKQQLIDRSNLDFQKTEIRKKIEDFRIKIPKDFGQPHRLTIESHRFFLVIEVDFEQKKYELTCDLAFVERNHKNTAGYYRPKIDKDLLEEIIEDISKKASMRWKIALEHFQKEHPELF